MNSRVFKIVAFAMVVAVTLGLTIAALFVFNMSVNSKLSETAGEVQELKELYLPVVEDMGFTGSWQDDEYLYIQIMGVKKRKCSPPQKIVALSSIDFKVQYSVEFMSDIRPDGTFRDPEEQPLTTKGRMTSFGVWRLKPIPRSAFWFQVTHNCSGRLITTNFILKDYTKKEG